MFSAAEMQLIRANCLSDFEELLVKLSMPRPDWSGEEFRLYKKLDDEVTRRICALMKSETVVDGYTNLLKLGGVPYDYSETYNQLLGMVVANKDKILRGLELLPKSVVTEEPPPQNINQPPPPPQKITKTEIRTEVSEKHSTLYGPIILGVILICAGLFLLGIGGVLLIIFGIISAFLGVKGKTVRIEKTVPVVTKVEVSPPLQVQPARKVTSIRKEVKPPFTRNELKKTLEVLTQLHKIICAI